MGDRISVRRTRDPFVEPGIEPLGADVSQSTQCVGIGVNRIVPAVYWWRWIRCDMDEVKLVESIAQPLLVLVRLFRAIQSENRCGVCVPLFVVAGFVGPQGALRNPREGRVRVAECCDRFPLFDPRCASAPEYVRWSVSHFGTPVVVNAASRAPRASNART